MFRRGRKDFRLHIACMLYLTIVVKYLTRDYTTEVCTVSDQIYKYI